MAQTIALVDDDRNLLTSISIALEREGFEVQTYIEIYLRFLLLQLLQCHELLFQTLMNHILLWFQ